MVKSRFQKIKDALFIPSLVLSIGLYLLDIYTDMYLVHRYYTTGEYWWCGMTVTFIILPWLFILYMVTMHLGIGIPFLAAILNMLPVINADDE